MIAAVCIAMAVMYAASGPVSAFIAEHPTTKMLALAFLVLIGMALVADGFEVHIPRGYIYFAMAFAASVEAFNVIAGRNRSARAAQTGGLMASRSSHHRRRPRHRRGDREARGGARLRCRRQLQDRRAVGRGGGRRGEGAGPQGRGDPGRHGGRGRRRAHVQDRGRQARAAHPFRLQHRHSRARRPARHRQLRDDARGDRGQRARRAVVAAARDPAHVEEARRAGRRDRAAVLGRGRHRRAQRIRLVRRLEGRDRVDDLRPEQGACRRRHPRQLRVAGRERDPRPRRRRHARQARSGSRR